MSKKVRLKIGVNKNLREITREIPDDQPVPWHGGDKLKYIGGQTSRVDGVEKATGRAKFTFDIQLGNLLYARFLRSPHPYAVIKSIDVSRAEKYPGVKAIEFVQEKLPMTVRFAGQEILAVAAETQKQADEAIKLIKLEFEEKKFVVDVDEARKPDAPVVFEAEVKEQKTEGDFPGATSRVEQSGNVRGPKISPDGADESEVDKLLNESDVIIEATYRTQVQTHSALETHGVVAYWEDKDKLKVWASTQGTFGVRNDLAEYFGLPKTNVQVLTKVMGGGFGAKFGAGIYGIMAAKLAKKANAPVRLMLNRKEEHLAVGNRPDSVQYFKIGAQKEGKITAIKTKSYGTAGVGTGAGTIRPAQNIYSYQKFYGEESDVFINAGPGAAFRAPGHPQGTFAFEQAIDELAYKLNLDPLEFRRINTAADDEARLEEYKIGAEKFGWDKHNLKPGSSKGVIKHGVGFANSVWYYFFGTGFVATLQVNSDGSVLLTNGVQDIGSGIGTVMAMVVAEELGLNPSDIKVSIGDTNYGLGPASGGSQTTAGITPAVRNAAYAAKMKIFEIAAPLLGSKPEDLQAAERKIFVKDAPAKSLTWHQVAARIPGEQFTVNGERLQDNVKLERRTIAGVQFAEVEVDTGTGVISVKKIVAVHDCGRPMNRLTLESQINGGIIQGISYALFENRILDRNTGIMVNPNYEQYKIAGSLDTPKIESIIIDTHYGQNATGALGIGEPATIPTAAAIANAVFHATGVRIRELPMTPARVLTALSRTKGGRS